MFKTDWDLSKKQTPYTKNLTKKIKIKDFKNNKKNYFRVVKIHGQQIRNTTVGP